ncbi:MAG: TIR domain-containing protein [Blastocatellia bacterium]|nr:TIR domain-containing protein [Blastocatellia bacterium]
MGERQPFRQFDRPIRVFFSYSHRDEGLRDELSKHLAILTRQGVICEWHDRQIRAGEEWAGEIDANLDQADVILLLVSADFLASDYCYKIEMERAMQRHEAREAVVVPIVLRPCLWSDAPFGRLQALPKNALPVTEWPSQDKAFTDVATGIRALVAAPRAKVAPEARAAYGEDVPRRCDRGDQTSDFEMFLREHRAAKALVCGIPAKETDLPESLGERFTNTIIRAHAEQTWGASHATAPGKLIPWPDPADEAARRNRLLNAVYRFLKCDAFSADPKAFAAAVQGKLEKVIVLRHTIRVERWAQGERELLAWYLDFWEGVHAEAPAPQFIVLFNLIAPERGGWLSSLFGSRNDAKKIDEEVRALFARGASPKLLLPELPCIRYEHVREWFDEHGIFDEGERIRRCSELFPTRKECRSMAEIEKALMQHFNEFQRGAQ